MAKGQVEKVLTVFAGISAGDVNLATQYIDHKRFVPHNPYAAAGVEGLMHFIRQLPCSAQKQRRPHFGGRHA